MKVLFSDSFSKSLKRLHWQNSWVYKTYSVFRYDIPRFIANIWRFKKMLWEHNWWDYTYTLQALYTSISIMEKNFSVKGYEVAASKDKKVAKMRRALELIKNHMDGNQIERVEEVLGKLPDLKWEFEDAGNGCSRLVDENLSDEEKDHRKKVYDCSDMLEDAEWSELWNILRGQTDAEYKKYVEEHTSEYTQDQIDNGDLYEKYWNGSGMNSWWD